MTTTRVATDGHVERLTIPDLQRRWGIDHKSVQRRIRVHHIPNEWNGFGRLTVALSDIDGKPFDHGAQDTRAASRQTAEAMIERLTVAAQRCLDVAEELRKAATMLSEAG